MTRATVRHAPRPLRRLASLLVAIVLIAMWGADAYGLHRCPHHDALPDAAAHHGGHAGHGGAPAHDATHTACTCLGACAVGGAIAAPTVTVDVFAVAPDFVRAVPAPTVPTLRDPALDLLPLTHAPPLA